MPAPIDRRTLLRGAAAASAGTLAGWAFPASRALAAAPAARAGGGVPFVDAYRTNVAANTTADTNAAVRALSGMARLWRTGTAWNTGVPLDHEVLRASMRYVALVTRTRTDAEARRAFIADRQHQSYAVISGLGPLAERYKAGALAVTSITSAPDGTPPGRVDDVVPAGAPAGAAIGAGSPTSNLGAVVQLVNTLRGPYASGNPSKYAYEYPRPWRMTGDSRVVDTGTVDAFGYPVYRSDVLVAPQLLRQRSTSPADDGGFPSGHTNAFHLAALALAYAIPERFQELVACAVDLSHTRIVAGMHSPVDVLGGRILATALAAATLADPANAALKAAAREQAAGYLAGLDPHTAPDPYGDREANARMVLPRLTYLLPRRPAPAVFQVPKDAEVLLETRQPYLSAPQRREVLRTTALPAGYPLLDGPEGWGRLNLFAAADGYGAFDRDVRVEMAASAGGFGAADTWRNPIDGAGGLVKSGTGALTLTGANRYRGGTTVLGGTLVAGSRTALGTGDVAVHGGATLRIGSAGLWVCGGYRQSAGSVLAIVPNSDRGPALTVERDVTLDKDTVLDIEFDSRLTGVPLWVLRTGWLRGTFGAITVRTPGYRAVPCYTPLGLFVRLLAR